MAIKHSNSGYSAGCRCAKCRAAHAAVMQEYRAKNSAASAELMASDPPGPVELEVAAALDAHKIAGWQRPVALRLAAQVDAGKPYSRQLSETMDRLLGNDAPPALTVEQIKKAEFRAWLEEIGKPFYTEAELAENRARADAEAKEAEAAEQAKKPEPPRLHAVD